MITYKKLVQKAYYKDLGEEAMWKMAEATDKFIEHVREAHPAEVDEFLTNLENQLCYPPLTKEQAEEYVSHMTNKDGSTGEHWNLEQVKAYVQSHPEYSDLNILDFYVAINMMYSDYYKPNYVTDNYASMARDFVADKDAPANKVVRYMKAMRD